MTHIQRYVVAEVVKVFILVIAATTLIMTLCVGINEGLKQGLPASVAMQLIPYVVPESLRMTVPASLLFSICTVFGRMSADGELTSVKALGIDPMRVFMPVVWLAITLSLATFFQYELCAVWARPGAQRTLIAAIDEVAYETLRAERALQSGQFSMAVKEVQGRELVSPRLRFETKQGDLTTAIASTASLRELGETGLLRITCRDLNFTHHGVSGTFPSFSYDIPFRKPNRKSARHYSPAELPAKLIDGQILYEEKEIRALDESLAVGQNESLLRKKRDRQRRLNRLRAEFPRRMANGFAALAFAVIGIPVAARSRSGDSMTVFFFCIVPIALFYYPLLVMGENLARGGFLPAVSVWLAPAALTAVGMLLLSKWTSK